MKISEIKYRRNTYATTNPPTSKTSDITLSAAWEITVTCSEAQDMVSTTSKYKLTKEQLREIEAMPELCTVIEELTEKMKGEAPPERIPLTGGTVTESFSLTVNGITLTSNEMTDSMHRILAAVKAQAEQGEVMIDNFILDRRQIFDDRVPTPSPLPFGMGMVVPQNEEPTAPPKAPADDGPQQEGEWTCASCGYRHNLGRFCVECGTPKNKE